MFLLIILSISIVYSDDLICDRGKEKYCYCDDTSFTTEFYNAYKETTHFHDKNTFGIDVAKKLGLDPCQKISKYMFIKHLNTLGIKCTGKWCVDGDFKCILGDNRNCYHMEHIYAKSGKKFDNYQTESLANVVFAAGIWNMQLNGLSRRHFPAELAEKTKIYGANKMNEISDTLKRCPRIKRFYDDDSDDDLNENIHCKKSCTCDSTLELDILCGCDYEETGFNISNCPIKSKNYNYDETFLENKILWSSLSLLIFVNFIVVTVCLITKFKNKDTHVHSLVSES